MTTAPISVQRLAPNAVLPVRAHDTDAGYDLASAEYVRIHPGEWKPVSTGLAVALARGTVGLIHPRSGLAAKHGVTVLNAPGTIDSGFRGEWKVILINNGPTAFDIEPGDRIAQLVIQRYLTPMIVEMERLPGSDRGSAGFGSTGVRS